MDGMIPQRGKALLDLRERDCRYPVVYDPEVIGRWWFCAAPTAIERVYCTHHDKLCADAATIYRRKRNVQA